MHKKGQLGRLALKVNISGCHRILLGYQSNSEPLKLSLLKSDLAELLPQYYKERRWNEKGIPTEAKLAQLGIA